MRPTKLVSALASASLILALAVATPASAAELSTTTVAGVTPSATNPTFGWAKVDGATSYKVRLYRGSAQASNLVSETETTALVWTPTSALSRASSTKYFWQAAAVVGGKETDVQNGQFTIPAGASPNITSANLNRAFDISTESPVFEWSTVQGARGYKLEYGPDEDLLSAETSTKYVATNRYVPTETLARLDNNGHTQSYYWRVTPLDKNSSTAAELSRPSSLASFTLEWPESAPQTLTPVDRDPASEKSELGVVSDPVLTWTAIPGARGYEIKMGTKKDALVSVGTSTSTTFSPKGLTKSGGYFWTVTAIDKSGQPGDAAAEPSYFFRTWGPTADATVSAEDAMLDKTH